MGLAGARRAQEHHVLAALYEVHPGLSGADLLGPAGEERPATPHEDGRPEDGAHRVDAVEVQLVAEPVHDHLVGDHDRNGQQQAPPVAAVEHLGVVTVILVAGALRSLRGGLWCETLRR